MFCTYRDEDILQRRSWAEVVPRGYGGVDNCGVFPNNGGGRPRRRSNSLDGRNPLWCSSAFDSTVCGKIYSRIGEMRLFWLCASVVYLSLSVLDS